MAEKIFMSYALKDRAVARSVAKARRRQGLVPSEGGATLEPERRVSARADLRNAVRKQIEAATKVVVIASESAEQSQWVNYEVGLADALGKRILVVKSKQAGVSTAFSKRLEMMSNVQALDVE